MSLCSFPAASKGCIVRGKMFMAVLAVMEIGAATARSADSPALFCWKGMSIMDVHQFGAGELGEQQCLTAA